MIDPFVVKNQTHAINPHVCSQSLDQDGPVRRSWPMDTRHQTMEASNNRCSQMHKILARSHVLFGKPMSAFPGHALKGQAMPGKRIQIDEETWQQLNLLGHDQTKDFQELADEALRDLLKKYGRPVDLKDALRRSAGVSATVHQLHSATRKKPPRK
jgi:hypothetical protein